ncbi:MAG: class I SAM-dependent methyltransferase, partial [Planctomycetes bacterium]|nr:class I SAM-dependent methyltransferase [Planctomycetota bacterium]
MAEYRDKHLSWARDFLARHDPLYRFRWDIYFGELDRLLEDSQSFLDAGCGENQTVSELDFSDFKLGVDVVAPDDGNDFCATDLATLPFANNTFDLIGCRFVLEHLPHPNRVFGEFFRVLCPGGYVLTQTSNRNHPLVFMGRLLPSSVKSRLTRRMYGHSGGTEFPTYHRFNRPQDFKQICAGLVP